jgi:outer membrane protein OmpA-like peptidoglycan-associated protein
VFSGVGGLVLVSVIAGIISAVGLPGAPQSSERSSAVDLSRLEGLVDVVIPEYEEENLWWVSNSASEKPETASEILGKLANSKYSRMLISSDVLFAANESTLTERSTQAIKEIVSTIIDPQAKVVVVCHSSSDGPLDQRLPLSEERASVLATALEVAMNRNPNSIDRVGLGDTSPLSGIDSSTVAGLALNRRCEVFVEIKK